MTTAGLAWPAVARCATRGSNPSLDGPEDPRPHGRKDPMPHGRKDPRPHGRKDPMPHGSKDPGPHGRKDPGPHAPTTGTVAFGAARCPRSLSIHGRSH
eukprot:5563722-Prymnesium_polylepis.1